MKKQLYITGAIMLAVSTGTTAQESIDYKTFEQKVIEYSKTLKQSQSRETAMKKAMEEVKTSFFPSIDLGGNYQYRINDYDMNFGGMAMPMKHNSYSAELNIAQPIYSGGNIFHNYKAQKIQSDIAEKNVELTTDNIILAAENSYWGTAAQKQLHNVICKYTDIISELVDVLKDKYEDGLISKIDLIQMEARLSEARIQESQSVENLKIAIQNMNILMGNDPNTELILTDSISGNANIPALVELEAALSSRPDYAISKLGIEYQKKQIKLAGSKYNPTLSIGFQETWGTQMLNISGDTRFNSTVFVSAKIPLVRWGGRFKSTAAQKALLIEKQYAHEEKEDQISKEICNSWTSMVEGSKQIKFALENCKLAEENLELNTFSYTEGKLPILDVLSAQLTWIQSYTNLIQCYYKQRTAYANYRKAAGLRYQN